MEASVRVVRISAMLLGRVCSALKSSLAVLRVLSSMNGRSLSSRRTIESSISGRMR